MQIGMIEGATRVIGKSQGYLGLPVRDEVTECNVAGEGTPVMVTAWTPTPDELTRLNAGASVHLRIFGMVHAQRRKEVIGMLFGAARSGNVAAIKKLEEIGRAAGAAESVKIVRTTGRAIQKALPYRYPLTRKFDQDCQDEMACYLLGVRGIDKYLAGRLSEDALINNLAREWASMPTTAGKGYYGGQHAAVSPARVREVLAEVKRRHREGQPIERVSVPVPVDRPVVPEAVEQKVKEKSNWLTWLTGGGGLSSIGLGWLAGMDWQAILAGGVVLIVMILILVLLRSQIIGAVRAIKAEVD